MRWKSRMDAEARTRELSWQRFIYLTGDYEDAPFTLG